MLQAAETPSSSPLPTTTLFSPPAVAAIRGSSWDFTGDNSSAPQGQEPFTLFSNQSSHCSLSSFGLLLNQSCNNCRSCSPGHILLPLEFLIKRELGFSFRDKCSWLCSSPQTNTLTLKQSSHKSNQVSVSHTQDEKPLCAAARRPRAM